ncbi:MAG TPA: hypothetical protein VF746_15240 [Longimicrobium sp.]
MATDTLTRGCGGNGAGTAPAGSALLPSSPFYAPRYHFGMLLGVDDFESEQAYHRGKLRLHNAWLHGEGVVWGLGVDLPEVTEGSGTLRGEVRVLPGFALDGAGRELHLEGAACVNLAAWYDAHKDDAEMRDAVRTAGDGTVTLIAHVVACFRACLSRPVPSISEPCDGSGGDVAYSRAQETVELRLVPGLPPPRAQTPSPYRRLRLLFALEPDPAAPTGDEQDVLDARADILALATEQQPRAYLAAFRRFAALDEIGLRPFVDPDGGGATLFPAPEDTCVVLARVEGITLRPGANPGDPLVFAGAGPVDNTVRPSHVATSTIQELLCGPLFRLLAAAPAPEGRGEEATPAADSGPAYPADAGGPRIDPDSVALEGEAVTFTATRRLSRASVAPESFSVSAYDNRDGWHAVEIRAAGVDRGGTRVRLDLDTGYGGNLVRIIARGTGPAPLLGSNGVPLAGTVGGPPGGTEDGHDFVLMLKRSET